MKYFNRICLVLLFFLTPLAYPSPSRFVCQEIVYYAKTYRHKKEILICLSGPYLTVTYGGIDKEKPEIDFLTPSHNASWFRDKSEKGEYSVGLSIKHDHYQYVIYGFVFDDIRRAGVIITRGSKFITNVKLDPRSAINTIDKHLSAMGLSENTPPPYYLNLEET